MSQLAAPPPSPTPRPAQAGSGEIGVVATACTVAAVFAMGLTVLAYSAHHGRQQTDGAIDAGRLVERHDAAAAEVIRLAPGERAQLPR